MIDDFAYLVGRKKGARCIKGVEMKVESDHKIVGRTVFFSWEVREARGEPCRVQGHGRSRGDHGSTRIRQKKRRGN